jgi:plastocyanin domain-containing protein
MKLKAIATALFLLPLAPSATGAEAKGKTVTMTVTSKGFEPAVVEVKKGEPITLVITRKTEKTCATDIVIDEVGIKQALPLNTPTKVTFTPTKSGELKYGCAMDKMVGGVLKVQ